MKYAQEDKSGNANASNSQQTNLVTAVSNKFNCDSKSNYFELNKIFVLVY